MQPFCPTEYHHTNLNTPTNPTAGLVTGHQPTGTSPGYATNKTNDIDTINPSYASYNNWSNGYNNYQYSACTPQPQYAPHAGPPTMVLYPHVYSTVNQNQIHLHLHGSDKLEQYLSSENSLTISSARGGIEIGITTSENPDVILGDESVDHHHHQQQTADNDLDATESHRDDVDDQVVGDPGSVWRPY